MKRTFLKQLFCLSCCIGIVLSAVPALAAGDSDSRSSVIDQDQTGTVVIDYQDTADGNDPVTDAAFAFYKIADLHMQITADGGGLPDVSAEGNPEIVSGSETGTETELNAGSKAASAKGKQPAAGNRYIPVIPGLTVHPDMNAEDISDKVQAYYKEHPGKGRIYTGKTGNDGKLTLNGMEPGVYLGTETAPAEDHYASAPFLFQLPFSDGEETGQTFWNYHLTVELKSLPAGSIIICKQVTGTAGDTNRAFHFKVEFQTVDGALSVPYIRSDGTKGTIQSGGVIPLKSGESAEIKMIPCGSGYTVTEAEADQNGYTTKADGTSGHIIRKNPAQVKFVNHKDKPADNVQTGDSPLIWIELIAIIFTGAVGAVLIIHRRREK